MCVKLRSLQATRAKSSFLKLCGWNWAVVPWVINFILLGDEAVPNLWEINYKFCKFVHVPWTTVWLAVNGRPEPCLMTRIPRQSSVRYLLKTLLTNQLNDTVPSFSFARPVVGHEEFACFRGEWAAFSRLAKMLIFFNLEVAAVLGHCDSSRRSEQSTPEVVWRSFEMASRPSLFCASSGRVSNLTVFGSMIFVNV
jgi:hypothetical protein